MGGVVGVLSTHWNRVHQPSERELRLLDVLARQAADLIERRAGQEALRASEARLRLALAAARMGIWTLDVATNLHMRDGNLNRLLGLQPVATTQPFTDFLAIIHPDDRVRVRTAFDIAIHQGHPLNTEFRVIWPDGTQRWLRDQGNVFGSTGGAVSHLAGACVDITERHEAEQAMHEAEGRVNTIANLVPDLLWSSRPDGTTDWYNQRWLEYTGQTFEQAISGTWADTIHGDDREISARRYREAIQSGTPLQLEHRICRADGTCRWFLIRAEPLRDDAGDISAWLGSATDINEQRAALESSKQHEESQRRSRAVAEDANRLKDDFLATLSHELRTPLGSILLWTQLLLQKPESRPLAEELNLILSSARSQKTLIEDLLDMSRITNGTLRLEMEEVDLLATLRESVDNVRLDAKEKGINLNVSLDQKIGIVHVAPDRIRQVLWNLLSNAIKFTPPGGTVELSARRPDGYIEIKVTDTGAGISPDFLPHIFERFRQADSSHTRSAGGLGLGLAIVKQLVELHGGTISVTSAGLNKGANFIVHLPLPKLAKNANSKVRRAFVESTAAADDALSGLMVLLVEDDVATRKALGAVMTAAGLRVIPAETAETALRQYQEFNPDLIVSDIGLPNEDGLSLLRKIRQYETSTSQERTPAVALTAFARESDRAQAAKAGFNLHLSKPVESVHLISVLRELVG